MPARIDCDSVCGTDWRGAARRRPRITGVTAVVISVLRKRRERRRVVYDRARNPAGQTRWQQADGEHPRDGQRSQSLTEYRLPTARDPEGFTGEKHCARLPRALAGLVRIPVDREHRFRLIVNEERFSPGGAAIRRRLRGTQVRDRAGERKTYWTKPLPPALKPPSGDANR